MNLRSFKWPCEGENSRAFPELAGKPRHDRHIRFRGFANFGAGCAIRKRT